MARDIIYVYLNMAGVDYFIGRMFTHFSKGKYSSSFEYSEEWLTHPSRYSLDPLLTLGKGQYHTNVGMALFGSFGDSAPDRWGRVLMDRHHLCKCKDENKPATTLSEFDYLLMVNDLTRQGALRFKTDMDGHFLADYQDNATPPLVSLGKLLHAANTIQEDDDSFEQLNVLLAPGSSLGGARPKASVRDNKGKLSIAKFPKKNDKYNAVLWEAVALELARNAKINTPNFRTIQVDGTDVLLVERFDRIGEKRIPYLSAMSMLGANDNETRSYLEILEALIQYGESRERDSRELWRRIVFSILINNTDDHLRNHAFLYSGIEGWSLSPVYDVNPSIDSTYLSTAIDYDDTTPSIDLAMSVAEDFDIPQAEAKEIHKEALNAVKKWRQVAKKYKIKPSEMDMLESAFEKAK